jgi:hypothetical protein
MWRRAPIAVSVLEVLFVLFVATGIVLWRLGGDPESVIVACILGYVPILLGVSAALVLENRRRR